MSICDLTIIRKRQFAASAASCNIIIDGIEYGNLKTGSKIKVSLSEGRHQVSLKWYRKKRNSFFSVFIPFNINTARLVVKFNMFNEEFVLLSSDIKTVINRIATDPQLWDDLKKHIVEKNDISLIPGEVCYYCNAAGAINPVHNSVVIKPDHGTRNIIGSVDGTLYITNVRIIFLAINYRFELYVPRISQIIFKDYGLELLSGIDCYRVLTADYENIQKLIELMNGLTVFKSEKWLEAYYIYINSTKEHKYDKINSLDAIDNLDGLEFENWCAVLLKKNEFENVEVTKSTGDHGVDILAVKGEIKYAIQCKHYSSNLGNSPVQEVYAGKSMYGCHVGVVMTNSHFTNGAKELAKATGVLLWDREKLLQMMPDSNLSENACNVDEAVDDKLIDAIALTVDSGMISASLLQRRLDLGYGRACKIIDKMEELGLLSEVDGNRPRRIIMSKVEYLKQNPSSNNNG